MQAAPCSDADTGAAAAGQGAAGQGAGGQGAGWQGEGARIGPNAVIQLAAAFASSPHAARARDVFRAAGVEPWYDDPPGTMLPEGPVAALHRQVRRSFAPPDADALLAEAGRLTADYLLANRIPGPARLILKALPPRPADRLLLAAIGAHAWTFAGSGRFSAQPGQPTVLTIADNPLVAGERADRPLCAWHAAVFTRLFAALVAPGAVARETHCCARGDGICRFEIGWGPPNARRSNHK